jgi:hypothetical protein
MYLIDVFKSNIHALLKGRDGSQIKSVTWKINFWEVRQFKFFKEVKT